MTHFMYYLFVDELRCRHRHMRTIRCITSMLFAVSLCSLVPSIAILYSLYICMHFKNYCLPFGIFCACFLLTSACLDFNYYCKLLLPCCCILVQSIAPYCFPLVEDDDATVQNAPITYPFPPFWSLAQIELQLCILYLLRVYLACGNLDKQYKWMCKVQAYVISYCDPRITSTQSQEKQQQVVIAKQMLTKLGLFSAPQQHDPILQILVSRVAEAVKK